MEGKAKFTRDESLLQGDEYVAIKEGYEKLSEDVRAKVNKIMNSPTFRQRDEDDEEQ